MKCDICNIEYKYSEDVIHHYTLIIDGKLNPHTHVCVDCEKSLGLKIQKVSTDGAKTKEELGKILEESTRGQKEFSSYYAENDMTLPYDFDLLYDIKTEAELLTYLHGDGPNLICSEDELMSTAISYGYTMEYLEKKFSNGGMIKAYRNVMADDNSRRDGKKYCAEIYQSHSDVVEYEYFETEDLAEARVRQIENLYIWKWSDLK